MPPSCYNQRSFILTKAMMRTNRSSFPMTQRGLPRIPGAASSLPCIGLLPPQSAEENLCRVRPLQHSEWRVLKGTQFGGTVERVKSSGASSRKFERDGALFCFNFHQKENHYEDHLQRRPCGRVPAGPGTACYPPHRCSHHAQAIKRLYPEADFAFGPATENGFYYDVDLATPSSPMTIWPTSKKRCARSARKIWPSSLHPAP